jgi:hypothetical protein
MTTADPGMSHTRAVLIDARPETVLGAVERLELTRPIVEAIEALGLEDRLVLPPTRLESDSTRESVYGMAWRIGDSPGYVKVTWTVQVVAGGETGTMLSTTIRFVATDPVSQDRLEAAWGIVGPASAALSKRALAMVKSYAEDDRPAAATLDLAAPHRALAVAA